MSNKKKSNGTLPIPNVTKGKKLERPKIEPNPTREDSSRHSLNKQSESVENAENNSDESGDYDHIHI